MYAPDSYFAALVLMLASMVLWGSWPNFLKKIPAWRLEYFYFDYTVGFVLTAIFASRWAPAARQSPAFVNSCSRQAAPVRSASSRLL